MDAHYLTATSELVQNYIQNNTISPTGKFEVLQGSDGHSLLFTINSSRVFCVMEEQSGNSKEEWKTYELSTAVIRSHFPAREADAVVSNFDVGQSAVDGSIGLMVSVDFDSQSHLFISLGNSANNTSWVSQVPWKAIPFDSVGGGEDLHRIEIVRTLFVEFQDKKEDLIVDILQPTGSGEAIARYYIDPLQAAGRFWTKHDLPIVIAE